MLKRNSITSGEIMKLLTISVSVHFRNYRDAKKIPFVKFNGKILYPKGEVMKFIEVQ